jgi:hypothetical protein
MINMSRKVKFTLSIGLANAERSETFTFEQLGISEDDYETEEELEEILNEEWAMWSNEYIDGGVEID